MRLRLYAGLAAIVIVVSVAGVLSLGGRDEATGRPQTTVSDHPVAVPASVRTVAVSRAMPMPSAHERRLSAMLEEGAMPERTMMADVVTDTECAPDAMMISRCRNVMRLESGQQIVVRHPHDMREIPCLAPGERVRLVPTRVS